MKRERAAAIVQVERSADPRGQPQTEKGKACPGIGQSRVRLAREVYCDAYKLTEARCGRPETHAVWAARGFPWVTQHHEKSNALAARRDASLA
jgi:hypothetical protein